jgi:hypothetical protein
MKKYGVYVKFSNAEEFAALGGYNDNEDNVVARTPSKNAANLEHLKQSVMEIVNPKVRPAFTHRSFVPSFPFSAFYPFHSWHLGGGC